MSANNQLVIIEKNKKWFVSHIDVDCGELQSLGKFDTLEKATDKANAFEKEWEEEGYCIEYGIKIIKNAQIH